MTQILGIVRTLKLLIVDEAVNKGGTSTHEEVGGAPATIGIVTVDSVADGPHQLTGKGGVASHVEALAINGLILQTSPQRGDVSADTEIKGVVELLHTEDVETDIGRSSPHAIGVASTVLLGLPVVVEGNAQRPVASETVSRILDLAGILCKGANRSH